VLLGPQAEPPEDRRGDQQVDEDQQQYVVHAIGRGRRRLGGRAVFVGGVHHGLQLGSAGVEQLATQRRTQQQGGAGGQRGKAGRLEQRYQHWADGNGGGRLADDRHVHQEANDHRAGDEEEADALDGPDEQVDQVLVAAGVAEHVGEAHRRADGDDELLVGEGD
jgi:hypothetical protein